ncbi:MAG: type II secretion system protein GspG [Phycisphaerae bacterium]|nr:type II secretion system protein GspG [Phycisphaerae bacterium]HBZ96513.1 type II secretion system protein GspG [Phycisphaerales bacterium]
MRRTKSSPMRHARRGFTLVEVIVIVTIMALLVTVVSTTLVQKLGQAKSELAKTAAARLNQSLNNYLLDVGLSSPPSDFDFEVLTFRPEDGGGPNGPYVNNVDDILDPWGNQFVLVNPGNVNLTWDITSYGEDGQLGGEGPNADVTN